jgi:hypothetical protein
MPKNSYNGNGGISVVQQDFDRMICFAVFPMAQQAVGYPQKVVFNRQPPENGINDFRMAGSWSANHLLVLASRRP